METNTIRQQQTRIYYRPELAKAMRKDMNLLLAFYSGCFESMYYRFMAVAATTSNIACPQYLITFYTEMFGLSETDQYEYFERNNYKLECEHEFISAPEAFRFITSVFKSDLEYRLSSKLTDESLTKSETMLIKQFYSTLYSMINSPNLKVQKEHSRSYYDRHPKEFSDGIKMHIEFIESHCPEILVLFETEE